MLPEPSVEQINIIENLKDFNLKIDSVAGSGKTTTNLFIAKKYTDKNILLLTYNKKLKFETREKVLKNNIKNMEIHSYHSFCVKYYKRDCFTDSKIISLIKKNVKQIKNFGYDLIIIDEAQDMTPLYFSLLCKIIKDNNKQIKICLLGDKNQSIYDFNKADYRYLTMADKILNFLEDKWMDLKLSTSFRLNDKTTEFINNCMMNYNRIKSVKKTNFKPRYLITDGFGDKFGTTKKNYIYEEIRMYLKQGYKLEDIFVLAPSVKSMSSPVRQLANKLSDDGIPIYVPVSDEEKIDEDIINGKLVFSTFHQVKGLERKVVVIFGFDDSYFQFYKKNKNPEICPNELYVACSRCTEKMSLIHHYQNNYLPFLKKDKLSKYCNIIKTRNISLKKNSDNINLNVSVSDLTKHLPSEVISNCLSMIEIKNVAYEINKIKIPIKTKQKNMYESVSEITGVAIPSYFEFLKTKKITILDTLKKELYNEKPNQFTFLGNSPVEGDGELYIHDINYKDGINEKNILFISNKWVSYTSGYKFKLNQITDYNWLSKENLEESINRLNKLNISNNSFFEKRISSNKFITKELLNRIINGYADCIDIQNKNLFEFKFTEKINDEHIIQTAIYKFIMESNGNKDFNFYLFNIKTEEMIEIKGEYEKLKEMIKYILYCKYMSGYKINNETFLINALKIKDKFLK